MYLSGDGEGRMSTSQEFYVFLIFLFTTVINLFGWVTATLEEIKHPGVLIGVLLALDIGILIILFLLLFGVFG